MANESEDAKLYSANQPYNQSDFYSGHVTILEPAEFDSEHGILRLTYRPFQLTNLAYGNPDFLRSLASIKLQPIPYASNKFDWKYDSRHKAQAILPFLFLGPGPVARDATYITDNSISMAIAVRSAQSARKSPKLLDPSCFPSCANIQTATFDIDSPLDVISGIKPIIKLMTDHLEARTAGRQLRSLADVGGRILVFCETGNGRSPVLVAAYLMLIYGMAWHESLNLIHAFRFSVGLSGSMNDMLKTLEGMLKAESDTAAALSQMNGFPTRQQDNGSLRKVSKRSIEQAYDSDEEMADGGEVTIRPGIAPFVDNPRAP